MAFWIDVHCELVREYEKLDDDFIRRVYGYAFWCLDEAPRKRRCPARSLHRCRCLFLRASADQRCRPKRRASLDAPGSYGANEIGVSVPWHRGAVPGVARARTKRKTTENVVSAEELALLRTGAKPGKICRRTLMVDVQQLKCVGDSVSGCVTEAVEDTPDASVASSWRARLAGIESLLKHRAEQAFRRIEIKLWRATERDLLWQRFAELCK